MDADTRKNSSDLVELDQYLAPFAFSKHLQLRNAAVGVRDARFQQRLKVCNSPHNGRFVEQVGGVLHMEQEALRYFIHKPGHIEHRGVGVDRNPFQREAGEFHRFHRRVLQRKHDLEDRAMALAAFGLQFLY